MTRQCVEAELPENVTADGVHDELIAARFLVPEGTDEFAFYRSVITLLKLHDRKNRKPTYTILPTLGCNARCVYCFQQGMKSIGMSAETAGDTLRFILNDCGGKKITLSWFGGEPLLREDVIDRISRGVRDAGVEYKSLMVTNGSLITPKMIEKMTELWHLDRIQISMDGEESDYIARKRYFSYRDDYHSVIDAVNRMSEAGISIQIRSNVDEQNIDGIPRFLEDLATGIRHKKNVSVYLTPLYQVMRGEHGLEVCRRMLLLEDTIRSAGFNLLFERFNKKLPVYHCMADAEGIVIAPDGTLHCCEDLPDSARIGNVKEGVSEPMARTAFIGADRLPEKCRSCVFLPDCVPVADCPEFGLICSKARRMFTLDALGRIIDDAMKEKA